MGCAEHLLIILSYVIVNVLQCPSLIGCSKKYAKFACHRRLLTYYFSGWVLRVNNDVVGSQSLPREFVKGCSELVSNFIEASKNFDIDFF
jgi:hypothetical protein